MRLVLGQGTCTFPVDIPEQQYDEQPPQPNRTQNMNRDEPDGHKSL
ncbi:MAG TPA: hypothetical protein VKZ57_04830 [Sphingobacterium sp.]|nr:hypothetical protein [Sphingobacterium sp.]